jgi:DnaJ domain
MVTVEEQVGEWKAAYALLNVPLDASASAIKAGYRGLMKRWHPDLYEAGSGEQAEATRMTELINEAYAKIARAPLRYYGGAQAPFRNGSSWKPRASRPPDPPDPFKNMDRAEWWIRFVMGALFGVFLALQVAFMSVRRFGPPLFSTKVSLAILVGCTLFCGIGAAKKADRFWRIFFGDWWRW